MDWDVWPGCAAVGLLVFCCCCVVAGFVAGVLDLGLEAWADAANEITESNNALKISFFMIYNFLLNYKVTNQIDMFGSVNMVLTAGQVHKQGL